MLKYTKSVLYIIILLSLITMLLGCTKSNDGNSNQPENEPNKMEFILKVKDRLITQFNPIILPLQVKETGYFTIQLQEQFVGTRPVIFMVQIVDIWESKNQTYIEFDAFMFDYKERDDESLYSAISWLSNDRIILQCNYEDIENYLDLAPQREFGMVFNPEIFYVVAEINSLSRTDYNLVGRPEDEFSVSLELDVSDIYVAKGKLISLEHLNNILEHN